MFVKDNALPHWDVLFPYTVCNCKCNLSQKSRLVIERHKLYCLIADVGNRVEDLKENAINIVK